MKTWAQCILYLASMSLSLAQGLPEELAPDAEARALRQAESIGRSLFRHDQAAAIATDAVGEMYGLGDKEMRGWVTEQVADSIVVTFLVETKSQLAARYRVVVGPDGWLAEKPTRFDEPRALTPFEKSAATALQLGVSVNFPRCGDRYNSVVLPVPDVPDRWALYFTTATTDVTAVPIGGAYRIDVDIKTGKAISQRAFTQSCLVLRNDPEAVAMMVTHLLDPVPTEIHVFWNLWARKPMIVLTPPHGTAWGVEDGKLNLLKRRTK